MYHFLIILIIIIIIFYIVNSYIFIETFASKSIFIPKESCGLYKRKHQCNKDNRCSWYKQKSGNRYVKFCSEQSSQS
jgi:hypothetical protein